MRIDLGRCLFCSDCVRPARRRRSSSRPRRGWLGHARGLLVYPATPPKPVATSAALKKLNARGCARFRPAAAATAARAQCLANVNFDVQRYGIEWVARRATPTTCLTGPLTQNMADACSRLAMPEPSFSSASAPARSRAGLAPRPCSIAAFDRVAVHMFPAAPIPLLSLVPSPIFSA